VPVSTARTKLASFLGCRLYNWFVKRSITFVCMHVFVSVLTCVIWLIAMTTKLRLLLLLLILILSGKLQKLAVNTANASQLTSVKGNECDCKCCVKLLLILHCTNNNDNNNNNNYNNNTVL